MKVRISKEVGLSERLDDRGHRWLDIAGNAGHRHPCCLRAGSDRDTLHRDLPHPGRVRLFCRLRLRLAKRLRVAGHPALRLDGRDLRALQSEPGSARGCARMGGPAPRRLGHELRDGVLGVRCLDRFEPRDLRCDREDSHSRDDQARLPERVGDGAIVAGGTLGILIPPSVTLILYGIATETSIGRLFLGGVVPGIMVTLLFCLWILVAVFLGRRSASSQQQTSGAGDSDATSQTVAGAESYSGGHRFGVLTKVIPFAVLIASVLGVLYLGIATPSEAAGVGAFLAIILVALLYRSVNVRNLMDIALETTRTSTMILMIVAFSAVLGQILSFLNVPQELAQLVADLHVNRWVVFLIMNLLFLFLGFFIPPVAIILVTMPVLFPIITELGFDPVWFGVVMTLNMEMGLITPPVGLNLYVVQGIAPDIPLRDILAGSLPYVGVLALGIVILALFPGLVTWLPNQTLGG